MQRLDEKLIDKIDELVGEGVRNVEEMRRHVKIYVKDELFRGKQLPERNNRRYFPSRKTKNHMSNATMKSRLSVMDQDNIQHLINSWKNEKASANDKCFFHPYKEGSGENPENAPFLDDQDSDHDTEDCAGEEVITKARMQEGRLLFVHSLAIKVAFSIWSGSCFLGCHLQNNQVLVTVILCCCQDQC